MSGFERYHRILRCFLQSDSQWSVKALAEALDLPASTLYRGIRELVRHRFLESVGDSNYRLGPGVRATTEGIRSLHPERWDFFAPIGPPIPHPHLRSAVPPTRS